MITAYHRPQSIEAALKLISRPSPKTVPLGGGTLLSHGQAEAIEVVDLQALGLNQIERRGSVLEVGATVTLQQLMESPLCPEALKSSLNLEAPLNIRNAATVGGTVAVCDGRSSFATVLLALDSKLTIIHSSSETMGLGDLLPVRGQFLPRKLITEIELPLAARAEFDYVARTPMDTPIVAIALAQWPSGRTRLAVGGYGPHPILATDGPDATGLEAAAANASHDANDPWGSAEYRMSVSRTLAKRCLARLAA
jgi:CO/xanthine dehydrogenase FAD-binding subunit